MRLLSLPLLLLALVLAAPSSRSQKPPTPAAKAPAAPKAPTPAKAAPVQIPDQLLEKRIRDRFARSKIRANGFQVKVANGVATLTGRTDVIQHKGVATRLARSAGARQVDNQIEISEAARRKAAERLARNKSGAPRKVQVQRPSSD